MRIFSGVLAMAFFILAGPAFGDVYDDIWISQCIQDNQNLGQTDRTIQIYCKCMNDKMSHHETRSISQWEKAHPEEEAFCSDLAGWKDR
ncbi:MAG: hypothetical protein LLG06_04230 [Desulfobacteraceae bacterium]|nr:hypothetical protein [Desulfobacteraceae bacterium]